MILDSSAIVAIFFQEPQYEILLQKLAAAQVVGIGAPTLVECGIVLSARMNTTVIPFSEAHFGVAMGAWLIYGKGRHPASLNFGDCLSYAVAKIADLPLLCVGDDFPETDIALA
jgi:ribonuclease VapC